MTSKIINYATISSPLLALYGASPFYIFNILSIDQALFVFLSALLSMVMYWLFNSYLFFKSKFKSKWLIYGLSYFFAYASNIVKVTLGIDRKIVRDDVVDYMLFPLITVLALNTIVLIIINSVIQQEARKKADDRANVLALENLKAQKQTLTQQLQPHFLFNALSILKSLIHEDKEVAEKYAVQLSDFLRYSVDSHNSDLVTVESELKFVKDYIQLQKIRFGDSFTSSIQIDESVHELKVPVLAIQTLVENAFKHNYFTQKNPMHISLISGTDKITVTNNITSLKLTEREGSGLNNLKKRYHLFGQKNIVIQKTDDLFKVSIPILEI